MKLIALPAMLALGGCVSSPPIIASASSCSSLLPESWRSPVPGAPLPSGETVGDWIAFADAQSGQLDKANDRTVSSIGIIERCEARDAAAIDEAGKRWWQFWR